MGNVTQQDRAEAVEFVEGRVWIEKLEDTAMAEKAERALAVLNAGIAALETLEAIETHRLCVQAHHGVGAGTWEAFGVLGLKRSVGYTPQAAVKAWSARKPQGGGKR